MKLNDRCPKCENGYMTIRIEDTGLMYKYLKCDMCDNKVKEVQKSVNK